MVLRFLSRISRRDLGRHDSPSADSPPTTTQGGSSNGARSDAARKMLAKLEKEGVELDDNIASIIDDEIATIKAEAARENINEPKRNLMDLLHNIACIAIGFVMGAEWYMHALRTRSAKSRCA